MTSPLMAILILVSTFISMEVLSWLVHKYLLHGPLWRIHQTHHLPRKGVLELNDVVSGFFGVLAMLLLALGLRAGWDWRFWVGCGISVYGLVYFVVHDVFIHRRMRWVHRSRIRYLQALSEAHKAHHRSRHKIPSESFGLLWVSRKYFKSVPLSSGNETSVPATSEDRT